MERALFSGSPWTRPLRKTNEPCERDQPNRLRCFSPDEETRLRECVRRGGSQRQILLDLFGTIREWKPSSTVVLNKAVYQIAVADTLKEWIPECRLIFVARDGRDAAISFRNFDVVLQKEPRPISFYADLWQHGMAEYLVASRRHEICLVTYEELTVNFAGTIGRVLSFLGLESDPETVRDMQEGSAFERVSGRRRGEEDRRSIFRKGVVGDWRSKFTPADMTCFKEIAGATLVKMGYERDSNWSL